MEITGKILFINNMETPNEQKPDFKKIVFALDTTQDINGSLYEGYASLETTNSNLFTKLNALNIGDEVKVICGIRGNKSTSTKIPITPHLKNPQNLFVFTSLTCGDILKLDEGQTRGGKYSPIVGVAAASSVAEGGTSTSEVVKEKVQKKDEAGNLMFEADGITPIWDDGLPF